MKCYMRRASAIQTKERLLLMTTKLLWQYLVDFFYSDRRNRQSFTGIHSNAQKKKFLTKKQQQQYNFFYLSLFENLSSFRLKIKLLSHKFYYIKRKKCEYVDCINEWWMIKYIDSMNLVLENFRIINCAIKNGMDVGGIVSDWMTLKLLKH